MTPPDMTQPEARAAQEFMAYKGYADVLPSGVEAVEGSDIWYFYYDLPQGTLELEVEWDDEADEWGWSVTAFIQAEERTPTPVG